MNDAYTRAPHRQPVARSTPSPNAALLIDFDNVTMGIRSNLDQELRNLLESDIIRGKVSVQRAYADWRRYQQYIVPLSEASIDLIFAPAYGSSKKNATDIRLAIDALELIFTRPEIGTFILLSGDSDFSSMVLKLKEYGKYVIGVGMQESSSDLLVQNCDEYYSYNRISGLTDAADMQTVRHDPFELVERALRKMTERKDVMRSDRLKQVMLELDSSFDEKEHGFNKFNRFLGEASSRNLVRLRKIANGQYEVAPTGESAGAEASSDGGGGARTSPTGGRPRSSRGGRGRGASGGRRDRSAAGDGGGKEPARDAGGRERPSRIETSSLRSAYDLLRTVVAEMSRDGKAVRDSEVKRALLDRNESFDETALGFRKFSRFLHQARDEGVVDLDKDENGNYHLSPADAGGDRHPPERPAKPRARSGGEERERAEDARATEEPRAETAGEEPAPEPKPREEPAPEPKPREEPAAAEEMRDAGDGGRRRSVAGRRRGGLGRFRRGRRGASEAPPAGDSAPAPGPAPAPAEAGDSSRSGEASEEPAESGPAPSGRGESPRPQADPPSGGDPHVVEHMVRNYAGVGRKTAEALVEEFGDEVMEVIDNQPGRLSRVLPEHRAQAVVAARDAERVGAGGL